MSLIPHSFMPRSMFDMDRWHGMGDLGVGPSTLDLFDPYDELDRLMGRNLQWLTKPDFIVPSIPLVTEKHRITLDCIGFKPSSIKTEIKHDQLVVSAHETDKVSNDDYSNKEMKKVYKLPHGLDKAKMVSFVTSSGQLVIEIPFKEDKAAISLLGTTDQLPRIVDSGKGVKMNLTIPVHIDPNHLTVTCKDRDVIVNGKERLEKPNAVSQVSYYRRTTMPENTDFANMKCTLNNGNQLTIDAPLGTGYTGMAVPIQSHMKSKVPINIADSQKKIHA